MQATILEIGTFSGIKQIVYKQTKAIDQNDVFEDSDGEFEKEFEKSEAPEELLEIDEEEMIIEEFDD